MNQDYSMNHWYASINYRFALLVALIVSCLTGIAIYRIKINTNIIHSLPKNDPVISDASDFLITHPIHDRIAIDVFVEPQNTDILIQGSMLIQTVLTESQLFVSVGTKETGNAIVALVNYITDHIPFLFSAKELSEFIQPMIEPEQVRIKLQETISRLQQIDGIGQTNLIAKDPLEFRNFILKKLSSLGLSHQVQLNNGQILSSDGRHLLIPAKPKYSGSDTTAARKITMAIQKANEIVNERYSSVGYHFTLTPSGAYRAALDNEEYAKADVKNSLLWSTIGIGILLFFTFPRPLIGLLSFVPAFVGTLMAFFVFSIFHESISIMTLGFGGAIISITVDQGIAYLLFLDQKHETRGKEASSSVWGFGILATLTTIIAFLMLSFSGFPILSEIGQFATLGGVFSFLFVHTVFPKIFPVMPAAKTQRKLYVHELINQVAMSFGNKKAWIALGLAMVLIFFAKPEFRVDLSAMNTVSDETKAAEQLMTSVWGNIFSKIYLFIEANHIKELLTKADNVSQQLEKHIQSGEIASTFIASMILPGAERANQNFMAWQEFWNTNRRESLMHLIQSIGLNLGFSENAFDPFWASLRDSDRELTDIPSEFFELIGIEKSPDGTGWVMLCSAIPGKSYDPEIFYSKFTGLAKVFDPNYFSKRLGNILSKTFLRMLIIVGGSIIILLMIVFLNWKLSAIVVTPTIFAFICTLGTLKLIGHPVDIPGIMLSIIILGMGIDYSICFVHAYQKFKDEYHPSFGLIRVSVVLTAVSTIIGFGVLSVSNHTLLKSAGLISAIGIFYSLLGSFLIIPTLMNQYGKKYRIQYLIYLSASKSRRDG